MVPPEPCLPPEGLAGVGATALLIAATRACEDRRKDRLFADPHAAELAGVSHLTPPLFSYLPVPLPLHQVGAHIEKWG